MGMSSKKTKSISVKNPVTHNDFLLSTKTARRLYDVASDEPIYDYHCHLSPKEIAEDKKWADLSEIWLGGDHYKWRAMRANGVPESHITGSAKPYEKFLAFARTMPRLLSGGSIQLLRRFSRKEKAVLGNRVFYRNAFGLF